jgi:esterase/lipase
MVKKELVCSSAHHQKLAQPLLLPEKLQQRNPAILFIHGWRSNQQGALEYAEALAQKGWICMTFDLRGHGSSQGIIDLFTRQDFLDDVLTVYDILLSVLEVDPAQIGVIGSSFGGYLGALLTTRRRVKYLALRASADYPSEGFEKPQALFSDAKSNTWRMLKHQPRGSLALNALHAFSVKC